MTNTEHAFKEILEQVDIEAKPLSPDEYRELMSKLHTHFRFRLDAIDEETESD